MPKKKKKKPKKKKERKTQGTRKFSMDCFTEYDWSFELSAYLITGIIFVAFAVTV